jgi:hypothetical protein
MFGSTRLSRQLSGKPIDIQGLKLQPVARLTGQTWSFRPSGGAARLHITPEEVLVTAADGQTNRVPIIGPGRVIPGWVALAAALALPVAWLLALALSHRSQP